MMRFRKKLSILDLQKKNVLKKESVFEQRKHVRIVSIDDEEFSPLANLLSEGYQVSYIGEHTGLRELRPYHIIICDVDKVYSNMNSEEHGAALIEEIKRVFPDKQVIVFSGLMGNVKKLKLARDRADYYIPKSAQMTTWSQTLDAAIDKCLDPIESWKKAKERLESLSITTHEISEIENIYVRSLISGTNKDLVGALKSSKVPEAAKNILHSLIASAIWGLLVA